MNPHNQPDPELLTRWSDGEMDDATRAAIEADPALRALLEREKSSAKELGDLLRDEFPAARDVAGPELFMHQLDHRLDQLGQATEPAAMAVPAARRGSPIAMWLAAAAALVAMAVAIRPLFTDGTNPGASVAQVAPALPEPLLATYAPDSRLDITARYDESADAVVIVVDGLKPVETIEDLAAFHPDDQRPIQARLAGRVHPHRFRGGGDS